MRPNRTRALLASGRPALGSALQIASPWIVDMMGIAGYDFVLLDGEHGAVFDDLENLIIAGEAAGITPIVRVPSHERAAIVRSLESGAMGIHVPMVNTPEEARALVREVKYPPLGRRGFSIATRAARYGAVDATAYAQHANEEVLLIVSLETPESLDKAGEIASVPGVDVVFVGPGDLASILGVPTANHAPEVQSLMQRLFEDLGSNTVKGTSAFSREDTTRWCATGAQYFLTSSTRPIRESLERVNQELRTGFLE